VGAGAGPEYTGFRGAGRGWPWSSATPPPAGFAATWLPPKRRRAEGAGDGWHRPCRRAGRSAEDRNPGFARPGRPSAVARRRCRWAGRRRAEDGPCGRGGTAMDAH